MLFYMTLKSSPACLLYGQDMVQATFLTELRGKEQRTYLLSKQDQLELQQESSNEQQRSSSFLTGFRGKSLLLHDRHMHRALAWTGV